MGQEATVRSEHGTVDRFTTGKRVWPGCILSPCLFNLYVEYILWNPRLDESQAAIKIAGRNINNLRYAADTILATESEENKRQRASWWGWKRRVEKFISASTEPCLIRWCPSQGPHWTWKPGPSLRSCWSRARLLPWWQLLTPSPRPALQTLSASYLGSTMFPALGTLSLVATWRDSETRAGDADTWSYMGILVCLQPGNDPSPEPDLLPTWWWTSASRTRSSPEPLEWEHWLQDPRLPENWPSVQFSSVAQSCPTLCDPMDCSLPGSSVHGILQARVLEWVAISFSRGSSRSTDQTRVSRIADRRFTIWAIRGQT